MAEYEVLADCPFPCLTTKTPSGENVSLHVMYKAEQIVTFDDAVYSPLPDTSAKVMVPHHFRCLDAELESLRQVIFAEERTAKEILERQNQMIRAGQEPMTQALKSLGETITAGLKEVIQAPVEPKPKRGPGRPKAQLVSTPAES